MGAFDCQPNLVVAPRLITDAKPIAEGIARIQPGGGTEIFSGLDEAHQQIRGSGARVMSRRSGTSAGSMATSPLCGRGMSPSDAGAG